MNREIKFRAWDGVDYITKPFTLIDIQNGKIQFASSDTVVMQYTGLKDKKGIEIYEGDIVKYPDFIKYLKNYKKEDCYTVGKIVYDDSCYWIWVDGSRIAIAWLFTPEPHKPALRQNDFEVLGNEFLNPELLNQK